MNTLMIISDILNFFLRLNYCNKNDIFFSIINVGIHVFVCVLIMIIILKYHSKMKYH
jgi:hypothetical protein